jgi:hypothetical protein
LYRWVWISALSLNGKITNIQTNCCKNLCQFFFFGIFTILSQLLFELIIIEQYRNFSLAIKYPSNQDLEDKFLLADEEFCGFFNLQFIN